MPKDLGEYVLVSELVHQLAPNHGSVFKLFLYPYMPDMEREGKAITGIYGENGVGKFGIKVGELQERLQNFCGLDGL
jgi:hypothetical protein